MLELLDDAGRAAEATSLMYEARARVSARCLVGVHRRIRLYYLYQERGSPKSPKVSTSLAVP